MVGSRSLLRQPCVNSTMCIGCGICKRVRVFSDLPAIRIASANEDRHLDNQPTLDLRYLGHHCESE